MSRFFGDQSKYPGMRVHEQLIWRAFLAANALSYDRFEYNVRLGPGITPPPEIVEPWRSASIAASKLRGDIIGWQGAQPTIFEVERYATGEAIGQVLTYRGLYESANPTSLAPHLAIVCADYNEGILPASEQHGIDIYKFPVDYRELVPPRLRS